MSVFPFASSGTGMGRLWEWKKQSLLNDQYSYKLSIFIKSDFIVVGLFIFIVRFETGQYLSIFQRLPVVSARRNLNKWVAYTARPPKIRTGRISAAGVINNVLEHPGFFNCPIRYVSDPQSCESCYRHGQSIHPRTRWECHLVEKYEHRYADRYGTKTQNT